MIDRLQRGFWIQNGSLLCITLCLSLNYVLSSICHCPIDYLLQCITLSRPQLCKMFIEFTFNMPIVMVRRGSTTIQMRPLVVADYRIGSRPR